MRDDEDEIWTGRVGSGGRAKVEGLATPPATPAGLMTVEPPGVRPEGSFPT